PGNLIRRPDVAEQTVLMLGLGRMGLPIAGRLARGGMHLHVHDIDERAVRAAVASGCVAASEQALDSLAFDRVLVCLPTPATVEPWLEIWTSRRHGGRPVI